MRRRRSEPKPLGELLRGVYPAREPEELQAIRAFRWWDRTVPLRVARNARPVRLHNGTLTIHVANSTWAQELTFLKQQLLASVRKGAPDARIRVLHIRVGPLPPAPRRPEKAPEKVALEPVELPDELARALAHIDDNDLREAIAEAATTCLSPRLRRG